MVRRLVLQFGVQFPHVYYGIFGGKGILVLYDGMESSIIHLKSPILGSVSEWQQVYCSDSGSGIDFMAFWDCFSVA